jgi:cell division protein FtsL
MTGTTMVVLIVLISVGFGVIFDMYKKHLEFKTKSLKHSAEANQKNSALQKQVDDLSQRVIVLEKIVTDEGYAVNKSIDEL